MNWWGAFILNWISESGFKPSMWSWWYKFHRIWFRSWRERPFGLSSVIKICKKLFEMYQAGMHLLLCCMLWCLYMRSLCKTDLNHFNCFWKQWIVSGGSKLLVFLWKQTRMSMQSQSHWRHRHRRPQGHCPRAFPSDPLNHRLLLKRMCEIKHQYW